MKTFKSIMLVAGIALSGLACEDEAPPPAPAVRPKPKAAAAPATTASAAPAYVYAYNPVGKRDPFRSPQQERGATAEAVVSACSEPLCQFDLEQLKLVAVITGDANPIAMVEDPYGRGHVVRRNTRIGKKGGKATQILRESVTITEYYTGTDGKVLSNPVSMQLKPDDQKDPAYNLLTGKNYGE
ncbi:pilus assembly protein PilP [Aggregicoccus sp. 17bor-14]|uniref:pilus assembly protein PilP n=1 Tax=Myxococcaceae TaxID=31 RepID=UPI00129C71A3|nr:MULTISPECIES: pilus assembly protein PilP [Myxococcaceae]MBF5044248.1 pilus assembly protein PilP [Simulacricoccus sp. 17bor-14]MRI89998.1 pilus assembly protein PilP [Aggregicoccus sp. 17bor-14]